MSKKNTTKKNQNNSREYWLWLGLGLFLIIGITLASTWYRYQINPDATSYFSIAQKYARGDFRHAINGYWSPLLSWLLVPFVWLNFNLIMVAKIISLFAGAFILLISYLIMRRQLSVNETIAKWTVIGLAPVILAWILPGSITPDVLFVAVLLLEIFLLKRFADKPNWINCATLGAAGALLYYTKFFGGYFFIAQVGLVGLVALVRAKSLSSLMPFIKVALVFGALILPFVTAISIKYHKPTLSTAGDYNQGIIVLSGNGVSFNHPMVSSGPFVPPNSSAYSIWEDPSRLPVPKYSPLKSPKHLKRFIRIVWRNVIRIRDYLLTFGVAATLGLLLLATRALSKRPFKLADITNPQLLLGVTAVVLIGGYSLILVEERYLWGLVVIGFMSLATFLNSEAINIYAARVFLILIALFGLWTNTDAIVNNRYTGQSEFMIAKQVASMLPPNQRIISDNFNALYSCYYVNLRCYSVLSPTGSNADQQSALYENIRDYGIQYLIDFHTKDNNPAYVRFRTEYFSPTGKSAPTSNGSVEIYKLN